MPVNVNKLLVKPAAKITATATPIIPVTAASWATKDFQDARALAETQGFRAAPGQLLIIPGQDGKPAKIYAGIDHADNIWAFANAAAKLPEGTYKIDETKTKLSKDQAYKAAIGWSLARYKFKIKNGALNSAPENGARLVLPTAAAAHFEEIRTEIEATWQVRDLINAPANILNTRELANEVLSLAGEFNAKAKCINGAKLEKEFPLIHTVGKASSNPPQLAYLNWQGSAADKNAPTILLVGKGVTFDTGGVQVKPGDSMRSMKKDMGGAATAIGLARMIMGNNLPVRLKLVIPIAENAISSNAFRPSDVITARDGTEVEIGHTDAEGRLILADALSFGAKKWKPELIIDFATLTGAQRIADGTEVGGVFASDKTKGRAMEDHGEYWGDDLQLHHLFEKYRRHLKSSNGGDICSSVSGPGATMAAMFLQHFIRAAKGADWFHFDVNGANVSSSPGRPAGGEAMGMRAAYRYIKATLG